MATFTYAFATISEVLKHDGRIKFNDLVKILIEQDPRRFRDEKTVENAVTKYTECLIFDGEEIQFDKNAKTYGKLSVMERNIQLALHQTIKDMERWQLYPVKTRENSDSCYIGIPWEKIPKDEIEERIGFQAPIECDFREDSNNYCRGSCGVDIEILKNRDYKE